MGDTKKLPGCSMLALYSCMFRRKRRRSSTSKQRCSTDATARLPSPIIQAGADMTALVVSPAYSIQPVKRAPLKYTPTAAANQRLLALPSTPKPSPSNGFSGELENMIYDHQQTTGSRTLVRATSGNVMVFENLGNIRGKKPSATNHNMDNAMMGNIVKKNDKPRVALEPRRPVSKDSEELTKMGNEACMNGRFGEALSLYDLAIKLHPEIASYRSNRGEALTGLGRLLEAVEECKAALRIEPSHCRAHHRLAKLYLRLGEPEKAVVHYKQSGLEASSNVISEAIDLQINVSKCDEARKRGDWKTVLREAKTCISAGADSAPQVYASQAEAFLKHDRHDLAEMALNRVPKFDVNASTRIFGATKNAYLLMVRAEVEMAAGRFDDAVGVAQWAAQLDPSNKETSNILRKAKAAASARSNGNDLFMASKFKEACIAYQEGLNHVPRNAIFLYNKAACRMKLAQWDRAVEDCNSALTVRPSYSKARLRRADCNSKLERWEAAIRDYEKLVDENPGDEELKQALAEAQESLRKKRRTDGWNSAKY